MRKVLVFILVIICQSNLFPDSVTLSPHNLNKNEIKKRGKETSLPYTRGDVINIMQRVASWQLANPSYQDNGWHNGTLYAGIMELYKLTKDPKYLKILLEMGKRNKWQTGKRPGHADDQCIGQAYIELYLIKKDPSMLIPVQKSFDEMMTKTIRGRQQWWWCDALFMAPPALTRLAKATGKKKYLDYMDKMWWDTKGHLYDSEEHLFFRDRRFFTIREKNGKKVFWSRGNGWVIAGLCRVLEYMPLDYPQRKKYVSLFQDMAAKIASLQQEDGFWNSSLLDPDSFPEGELSGTGFFTFALAWGINSKLLSREKYIKVVDKGWKALSGAVADSGKLGWIQPVGDRPKESGKEDSAPYGTGAFLLAGCEIARLLPNVDANNKTQSAKPE